MLLERDPLGYLPLRETIAAHLRETRGLPCTGAQVMIVSGMQMTLDLCTRTLLDPGDQAWVEEPGYPGAARLLAAAGMRPVPVPVDAHGLCIADGDRRAPRARLAVVTAGHQFPLGVALAAARRAALLRWAETRDAWVLEDDYDSEFRFAGPPALALQAMPGGERVLFAGSFNKMLFPALRLGFLVLPPALVEPLRAIRSLVDRFPAAIEQAVLADFIGEGHFERHLRRMRVRYAERQETLLAAAAREWGPRLVVTRTETGIQTTAWLRDGLDAEKFATAALARGIELVPLTRCALTSPGHTRRWLGRSPRAGLQIGFGAMTPSELRAGVSAVATLLDSAI
jgi:GntR family transcriptional regulator / MocR family aminotransferase